MKHITNHTRYIISNITISVITPAELFLSKTVNLHCIIFLTFWGITPCSGAEYWGMFILHNKWHYRWLTGDTGSQTSSYLVLIKLSRNTVVSVPRGSNWKMTMIWWRTFSAIHELLPVCFPFQMGLNDKYIWTMIWFYMIYKLLWFISLLADRAGTDFRN